MVQLVCWHQEPRRAPSPGALNERRLETFRERFSSMGVGERFMYGTHYSAPAFVAFLRILSTVRPSTAPRM